MANSASSPEVKAALDRARDNQGDTAAVALLETAVGKLWERIKREPEYVLTREEFALFNYFIYRYGKLPEGRRAVEQFWNHYNPNNSASNGSKTYIF
ncbi:hypothetical protein BO70DRAFT_429308 [Aspergillus heteromorphus CBS 117.55]|uniref:Uncharacterized protein n=1 Tax=Aspergillus heteromorphus CBS 117.55 TaxID=1448321 RepID=A0A317W8Z0_9EURO|nr:uncharacterized protein BO70DRAFT_429308 [Aspergillus heteromorphus CBS 117.55]PWY81767.1 hypothetical protein BO70DRAFT_429308 [Aspergillus heteromorphus CBS 117.55]